MGWSGRLLRRWAIRWEEASKARGGACPPPRGAARGGRPAHAPAVWTELPAVGDGGGEGAHIRFSEYTPCVCMSVWRAGVAWALSKIRCGKLARSRESDWLSLVKKYLYVPPWPPEHPTEMRDLMGGWGIAKRIADLAIIVEHLGLRIGPVITPDAWPQALGYPLLRRISHPD